MATIEQIEKLLASDERIDTVEVAKAKYLKAIGLILLEMLKAVEVNVDIDYNNNR